MSMKRNGIPHLVKIFFNHLHVPFNPLTPVPARTGSAKTHPRFPVLAVTGHEKACEDNGLSYPP